MSEETIPTPLQYARVLACASCQSRKVKCDRKIPCSNCIKANINCAPHTPPPSRKRRRPNEDLRERLARCEELLEKCIGAGAGSQSMVTPSSEEHNTSQPAPCGELLPEPPMSQLDGNDFSFPPKPPCLIVQDEHGSRLVDGYVWACLHEELQKMRDIVEAEDSTGVTGVFGWEDGAPGSSTELLLSGDDPSIITEDLQPKPVQIFRMWQVFLNQVNPLTKVIHAPTLQPYIMEASTSMSDLPLDYQALLFAIYASAVYSLSGSECLAKLAISRDKALQKFTLGAKLSLLRLNFLKHHNMTTLQALIIFLCSLADRHDHYSSWILSGILVRIAQKMGYHRDGEALGLTPFETEMRRRIWWCIVVQDASHAMAVGLSSSMLPLNWDTKEPLNLNDADLFPNSSEPLHTREGPTEMGFCLILHRIYRLTVETDIADPAGTMALGAALLGQAPDGNNNTTGIHSPITAFQHSINKLDMELQDLERKYLNAYAGNTHVAALMMRPMLLKKLAPMCVPMQQQPEWGTEILGPEDTVFKILVVSHEYVCEVYEGMSPLNFEWSTQLLLQSDQLAYLTGQLCQRPTGSLSDRGWKAIEKMHKQYPELVNLNRKRHIVQAQRTLKAWQARELAIVQAGQPVVRPEFIAQLREALSSQPPTQSVLATPLDLFPPHAGTHFEELLQGHAASALQWDTFDYMVHNQDETSQTDPMG